MMSFLTTWWPPASCLYNDWRYDSPQLSSKSLHPGASSPRVRLWSGELFILGTNSLMLVGKNSSLLTWTARVFTLICFVLLLRWNKQPNRQETHSGAAVHEGLGYLQHVSVFCELQEVPLKLLLVSRHLAELHLQPLKLLLDIWERNICKSILISLSFNNLATVCLY